MFIKLSGGVKTLLKTFALGIPVGVTLIDVFGYVAKVEGHSMQPLLNPDNKFTTRRVSDYVFLHNWPIISNSYDEIQRGEIIALVSPRDPKQRLIKRVIGLSGDLVETKGYYKPYIEVPAGHCWVEGDNRGHSLDSNVFGPVALGLVKSKATCIVWPPARWQFLDSNVLEDRIPINLQPNRDLLAELDVSDRAMMANAKKLYANIMKQNGVEINIRTRSLVDCVELKFPGNILKDAFCFGDVDNDGLNEIIAGNTDGDLFIYKDGKCICRAFDLGCIAAIAVGNLLNNNRNVTVVVTTEGHCHIFDVEDELNIPFAEEESSQRDPSISSVSAENLQNIPLDCRVIQQFHSQRIVANAKVMFVADVNDDTEVELVLALTDRVLRTYKWNPEPVTEFSMHLEERDEDAKSESIGGSVYDGRLQAVNKWELANQIGSISPHRQGNLVSILIGQPGGSVTRITEISEINLLKKSDDVGGNAQDSCHLERGESSEKEFASGQQDHSVLRHPTPADNISIKYHALNLTEMRNQNISTDVAGNIMSHDGKNEDSYVCATYDGTILICKDDTVEWSLKADKPLLTVQSFCGSAIIVDWEGPTYLINRKLDPVMNNCVFRFYFEDHVAAFRVGMYGMRKHNSDGSTEVINQKCFAYVTFNGSIYIYPNEFL